MPPSAIKFHSPARRATGLGLVLGSLGLVASFLPATFALGKPAAVVGAEGAEQGPAIVLLATGERIGDRKLVVLAPGGPAERFNG